MGSGNHVDKVEEAIKRALDFYSEKVGDKGVAAISEGIEKL